MKKIVTRKFGSFKNKDVIIATLFGDNDTSISIINWGASIQNWITNDGNNNPISTVLGFENFDYYPLYSPSFGSIIGRVINRISKGQFSLNGKIYKLDINDEDNLPNHLHGGETGFGKSLWDFEINDNDNSIKYFINSQDGHEGYPGNVDATVNYRLESRKLYIEIKAMVDRETPINMGQHNYFNLCSKNEKNYNICNHFLYLDSSKFTETDLNLIPTGEMVEVNSTKMDFSKSKEIGNLELNDNYVLNSKVKNKGPSAILFNPTSKLTLNLWTNQPGIQVFNAPKLDIKVPGLNKTIYKNFSGICLEAQMFPDSVNQQKFPSIISSPENPYFQKTEIEII